jgi:hypothetical protein
MAKCTKNILSLYHVIMLELGCDFFFHPSIWTISDRVFIEETPYMYIIQVLILLMINHGLTRFLFVQCLAMT